MSIFVGETGRTIRLNAGFDMSFNTDIKIHFVAPSGEIITKGSADGVALMTQDASDPVLGDLLANQFVEFEATADLFQDPGMWRLYIEYENHNELPAENIYGETVKVTVRPRAESVASDGCDCG